MTKKQLEDELERVKRQRNQYRMMLIENNILHGFESIPLDYPETPRLTEGLRQTIDKIQKIIEEIESHEQETRPK